MIDITKPKPDAKANRREENLSTTEQLPGSLQESILHRARVGGVLGLVRW